MTNTTHSVGGIVLCGGKSRRMGQSKAMMPFAGEPMLVRVVRLLSEAVGPIVVVAAPDQDLPELPLEVTIAYDRQPDRGPLEALAVGLGTLAGRVDRAFVIACDTPLLLPEFIRRMVELSEGYDVAVPSVHGMNEPLAAVYATSLLPEIESLLAANRLRPAYLFDRVYTRRVTPEQLIDVDPKLVSLVNVNNPADYKAALASLDEERPANKALGPNEALRPVAGYAMQVEADLLKLRLEQAGMRACLSGGTFVGWFWHYANATGGIKVLVAESDLPLATELFEEYESQKPEPEQADVDELPAIVRRACLASVLSLITVFPPLLLNIYSMWLIAWHKLFQREMRPKTRWLLISATVINILWFLFALFILFMTLAR